MSISHSKMKKTIAAGIAALTLGGAAIASATPAEAQWGGGWRHHGGWRHGGFHHAGWCHGGFHHGYRHYHRPHFGGGAVAAGLVGGLALGALAASPAYGYGYGYAPVAYGYGGECFVERRRSIDPWGRVVVRKIRTCY